MFKEKEVIIINAIPNSEAKIKMLEEQLLYFKKLNAPIILVSGCNVPEHIATQVDYIIVNNDNEVIGKDYSHKMYNLGLTDLSYDYFKLNEYLCVFYWQTVNSTITKNIKLGFSAAKILGYERAFYTEDDNIFKDGSFYYLENNMSALRSGEYKMAGWTGELNPGVPMMCTAFFFADVNWMVDTLTIPHMREEWYDYETTVKYHFHKPYEYVYYRFFEDRLNVFYNSVELYRELENTNENNSLMDFGKSNRRFSEKNLIDTFFTVLRVDNDPAKQKMLILVNVTGNYLANGGKDYDVEIFYDGEFHGSVPLWKSKWYQELIPNDVEIILLRISGYGDKYISCDMNEVKNNGHIIVERAQEN